jgi:hypothetical protein
MIFSLEVMHSLISAFFLFSLSGSWEMEAAMLTSPIRRALASASGNECHSNRSLPALGTSVFSGRCVYDASPVAMDECSVRAQSGPEASAFRFELWLDLIETAISQSDSAVQVLHDAILSSIESDERSRYLRSSHFWDKVVVGGSGCIKACSVSLTSFASVDLSRKTVESCECTFHPAANVVGDILRYRTAGVVDPLLALETVVSGKWIMIDCSAVDFSDSDPFPDRLECLLEFLFSSVYSSYPSRSTSMDSGSAGKRQFGGVSVRCNDMGGLVHVFRVITRNLAACHAAATESGLLIPKSFATYRNSDKQESDSPVLGVSIAIPLDSQLLWETALSFLKEA